MRWRNQSENQIFSNGQFFIKHKMNAKKNIFYMKKQKTIFVNKKYSSLSSSSYIESKHIRSQQIFEKFQPMCYKLKIF